MSKTDPHTEELRTEAPLVPDIGGERTETTALRLELAEMRAQLDRIERAMQTTTTHQ